MRLFMRPIYTKQLKAQIEMVKAEGDDRWIRGYASIFDVVDSYGDVVVPGAFARTLDTPEERNRVVVLWQHDVRQPIGVPTVMREDSKGLYVEAKISKTARGDEALALISDGVVKELSIGFNYRRFEITDETTSDGWPIWYLKDVELMEWSPVTWGACPGTVAEMLKAMKLEQTQVMTKSAGRFYGGFDYFKPQAPLPPPAKPALSSGLDVKAIHALASRNKARVGHPTQTATDRLRSAPTAGL